MTAQDFQNISHTIPHFPGIYKYYDASHKLLYVGKAKNLRKRVGSYFSKAFTNYKTHELVNRIHQIEFTIVDSEQDAFLLENSLIKQYQPLFNINLKDDKSYPFIVIKKEPFPRVFLTRRRIDDGSTYLGPFTSVHKVRELLDFIKQNIQLRTCKLNLTENNIKKRKFKVCLEYHLGNCKGPCEDLQSEQDYMEQLSQLTNFMKGNLAPIIQHFKGEMKQYVEKMMFEKAELMKKKIDHLESYRAKSVVVSRHLSNLDVFAILKDGDVAYVNYLQIQNGAIIQTHTTQLETHLEESAEEVLAFAIAQIRPLFESQSLEVLVPFPVEYPEPGILFTVPKGGDKKKLLELSEKNVNYFKEEIKRKNTLHLEGSTDSEKFEVLEKLKNDLQLSEIPVHIECFDNSNFQGSFPVSAMVCFKNGIPSKKDYRHYNVQTVTGINDFATMKEVVFRRYRRVLEEALPVPQLIIIDGGKGQLSSAMESINELGLNGKTTVVGLAKNEEEIFFPGEQQSIKLPYQSESLKLIRNVRDEVHRFGITFHRKKRSKGTFKNELEGIRGIGENTANQLLKHFRSVTKIREAEQAKIAEVIGNAKAKVVFEYFSKKADNNEKEQDVSA